ncbi:MAG: FAD-dependent monooxygenase [Candidatus Micrarchaeia archaeon]
MSPKFDLKRFARVGSAVGDAAGRGAFGGASGDGVFDVVVVGGGTAGCFLSRALGDGLRVLLVEKDAFPRKKPCGGVLVEESSGLVEKLGVPKGVLSLPIDLGLRHLDVDNGIDVVQGKRGLVNISRVEFDSWLHSIAQQSSSVASGTRFVRFERCEGGFRVFLEHSGKEFGVFSRFLVGSDGASSSVRPLVCSRVVPRYVAVQETGVLPRGHGLLDAVFVYDDSITDYYSWVIPKGDEVLVGTALRFGEQHKFSKFVKKLKALGFSWKRKKMEAALLSRPMSVEDLAFGENGVFLVGEAAGLVSPSTGEGISFALRSALACAKAIRRAGQNPVGDYEKLCAPLVKELADKMDKAKFLSGAQSRNLVFGRLAGAGKNAVAPEVA